MGKTKFTAPNGIGKFPWMLALLGSIAAGLAARFGGGLSGFQSAFITLTLLIPLLFSVLIFALATKSEVDDQTRLTIRWLVRGYLAIAFIASVLAIVSLFFGWPLRIIPVPDPGRFFTVTVPVSTGICDAFDPATVEHDPQKKGFFRLPSKHTAVFSSSDSYAWTNDRLDSIEGFLNTSGFVYDLAEFISRYEGPEVNKDDSKFIERVVKPLFQEMVAEGIASTRPTGQFRWTEDAITKYVRLDLLPLIKNDKLRLPNSTKAWIDTTTSNPIYATARVQVWKRILAHDVLNSSKGDHRIFGPYSDPSKLGKSLPSDPRGGHPSTKIAAGSLVALPLEESVTGKAVGTNNDSIVPFSEPGHTITNTTDKPIWIRFGINDSIPEDNGPGYADVHLRVVRTE